MMNLDKWSADFGKKAKWYDYSILKASVFFFTLFLITVWPDFNKLVFSIGYQWYLVITIVLVAYFARKMLMK